MITVRSSLLALLFLAGCNEKATEVPAVNLPTPHVKVANPLLQETLEWDEYTGRVEAVNEVEIRARVSGYLEKVLFKAGEKVKKGDLLFQIDAKPFKAQLNHAQAELERAQAKHELAKNDLARAENLLQLKAISVEEYDRRSKAVYEAAAAVHSAEANVYSAKLNVEFTEIRAPISGRISREFITAGNLVNAENTPLANLVSIDPVYVTVDVDEHAMLQYRRAAQARGNHDLIGTPVQVAVADEAQFLHTGKLDYVAPSAESATGTVTLRGVFANPDELLSAGFFARMRVQGKAAHNALLLPERAINKDQTQRFVWIVNAQNQVEYRSLKLGGRVNDLRVIEGVQANESVVIEGGQKLKSNASVIPEPFEVNAKQLSNQQ